MFGFEDHELANSPDTWQNLIFSEDLDTFLPLLQYPEAETILKIIYQWVNVQASNHNIMTAADRASKVVFALKTYARYDKTGRKILTNIPESIDTVLTLYQNQLKHNIEVIRNYPESLPAIPCYFDELNQVWTNLIQNAIQAMDNQGILTITVKQEKQEILVNISDNGKGIPKKILPKIFEPFFTTKSVGEGSGLGLDIVKKIIDKHNGTISVTSIPGKTNFVVCLPIEITPNS